MRKILKYCTSIAMGEEEKGQIPLILKRHAIFRFLLLFNESKGRKLNLIEISWTEFKISLIQTKVNSISCLIHLTAHVNKHFHYFDILGSGYTLCPERDARRASRRSNTHTLHTDTNNIK